MSKSLICIRRQAFEERASGQKNSSREAACPASDSPLYFGLAEQKPSHASTLQLPVSIVLVIQGNGEGGHPVPRTPLSKQLYSAADEGAGRN
jgi:hypothetical protein